MFKIKYLVNFNIEKSFKLNTGGRTSSAFQTPVQENHNTVENQFRLTSNKILNSTMNEIETMDLLYDLQDFTSVLALIIRDKNTSVCSNKDSGLIVKLTKFLSRILVFLNSRCFY